MPASSPPIGHASDDNAADNNAADDNAAEARTSGWPDLAAQWNRKGAAGPLQTALSNQAPSFFLTS
jgi:hypothetical protein